MSDQKNNQELQMPFGAALFCMLFLLGLQYDASSVDSEMVTMMTAAIQENFHMNILLLLPAVAVIVMAVCKCPSIPPLLRSVLRS